MSRIQEVWEARNRDTKEAARYNAIQVKIWRSASIIHAHHPEIAKDTMLWFSLYGMLVGNYDELERKAEQFITQAQKCGRSLGVFSDKGLLCENFDKRVLYRKADSLPELKAVGEKE